MLVVSAGIGKLLRPVVPKSIRGGKTTCRLKDLFYNSVAYDS